VRASSSQSNPHPLMPLDRITYYYIVVMSMQQVVTLLAAGWLINTRMYVMLISCIPARVCMQEASEYMHVHDGDEIDRDRLIIMGTRLPP